MALLMKALVSKLDLFLLLYLRKYVICDCFTLESWPVSVKTCIHSGTIALIPPFFFHKHHFFLPQSFFNQFPSLPRLTMCDPLFFFHLGTNSLRIFLSLICLECV